MNSADIINIVIVVAVFGLVFSIWCICVLLWLGQYLTRLKTVQKKLGIVRKESEESKTIRLWREVQDSSIVGKRGEKLSFKERVESYRQAVGWHAPLQVVLLGLIGLLVLGFLVAFVLSNNILISIGVTVALFVGFTSYAKRRLLKNDLLFERQLLDALGIASRALRAGHPLIGAFQLVAEEIPEPLGGIFFRICKEQEMGLDLRDSLYKVARLSRNEELKLLATSVVIQFQSGGNFADLMDTLSSIIRERIRLNKRIRVITAQTQFSKKILIALPVLLFFVLYIINPGYMQPLLDKDGIGRYLLGISAASVIAGAWLMNRMSVIRF